MEKSYIVMGTFCLVIIFLGILIYFLDKQNEKKIKQTEKEDSKERSRKELLIKFKLRKKKLKNKELKQKIIDNFLHDSKSIKYRIKNNRLDILMYDFDTPFSSSFNLSKNRDLLILNNGTFSLENSFFIGAITNKSTTNNYVNFKLVSNNVIDNTDYRKIYFQSGETSFLLCSYSFSNSLFKKYQNEISESYSLLIRTFVRIFNDASGKCDYEDVRATEEEEKLLDKLIEQKTN